MFSTPILLALGTLILLLIIVLWVRIPIALTLAGLGCLGVALLDSPSSAVTLLGNEFWGTFSSYGMTVVPLFILMGQICFYAGFNERLYRALNILVGHLPGGLGIATILACGGFSAICGSNTATAATMSGVALPEMRRYGYNPIFSAGTVAVGATLGVVIPPSVALIIIGLQTGLSVSTLFMASVLPGLLLMLAFTVCAYKTTKRHPDWTILRPKASLKERVQAVPLLGEIGLLWGCILGGMSTGLVTPTEAGGLGSLLALLMGAASKRLTLRGIIRAFSDTLRLSAMILLLVTGAMIYGKFLAMTRLPFELADAVAQLHIAPVFILLAVFGVYFVGGALMDALALLLISIPIFFPLIERLGYDPVWFSLLVTIITTLGAVTPPVGVCAYVVSSFTPEVSLPGVFKGVACYMPAYFVVMALLFFFPFLVTGLPMLMGMG